MVKAALKRHAEEWRYKVEVKQNALLIHEAGANTAVLERIALPWLNESDITRSVIQNANYTAVLKLILVDDGKGLFIAERFCSRGSVNDWIGIGGGPQTLRAVNWGIQQAPRPGIHVRAVLMALNRRVLSHLNASKICQLGGEHLAFITAP